MPIVIRMESREVGMRFTSRVQNYEDCAGAYLLPCNVNREGQPGVTRQMSSWSQRKAFFEDLIYVVCSLTYLIVPQFIDTSMNTNFQPSDIVILVTGAVGAGRSTFINDFLGNQRMIVGNPRSLATCTTWIDYEIVNSSSQRENRLVIVDTPGFDNENKSDFEVLQEIASWLQESFPHGVGRGGIIYLYDISSDRYRSMGNTNIGVLIKSFGKTEDTYRRIVLATTKWSRIGDQEGTKRQTELESRWNQLIARGSKLDSFKENSLDAQRIVDEFCRTLGSEGEFNFGDGLKDIQKVSRKPGSSSRLLTRLNGLLGTLLGSRV
ncbi:hypothetical protein K435DRAFT_804117 [Dendrothele bispora CBS 962.96]|uniref:G domain-containing protein n=1 Tax=Dendrothele bispora (strain CBS 962.96) TaxID=1314807 RepID=A0A4S8LFU7_DENBC|nr:hypothetical protein K435DRAFT_804117 [Dendrothele bispora CBS 962.96]